MRKKGKNLRETEKYRPQNPNFAIAKLQSCQHIDNLDVSKITFGNFASVKIVDIVNN